MLLRLNAKIDKEAMKLWEPFLENENWEGYTDSEESISRYREARRLFSEALEQGVYVYVCLCLCLCVCVTIYLSRQKAVHLRQSGVRAARRQATVRQVRASPVLLAGMPAASMAVA